MIKGAKKSKQFDLQKGVDFIGVTCVFYCHDGKGKLLLHKRSKNCRDEVGRWDVGGGSMEFGEEFDETIKREVKEEYGVDVLDLKFLKILNVLRKNKGIKTHWVAVYYLVLINPKGVKIGDPEKMDDIGWFELSNLPKPLHSNIPKFLNVVKEEMS